jgi:small-conductance mechanosensitive channel
MKTTELLSEAATIDDIKLRLELARMRENDEQQHDHIVDLTTRVAQLEKTVTALIRKLGPK